jgi:hypothetical protein
MKKAPDRPKKKAAGKTPNSEIIHKQRRVAAGQVDDREDGAIIDDAQRQQQDRVTLRIRNSEPKHRADNGLNDGYHQHVKPLVACFAGQQHQGQEAQVTDRHQAQQLIAETNARIIRRDDFAEHGPEERIWHGAGPSDRPHD